MGPGHQAIPALESPANYTANVFTAAAVAAAAEDRVPPFEPKGFPSTLEVAKWLPGREVDFHQPMDVGAVLGCLPLALAGFAFGPAVYVLGATHHPYAALFDPAIPLPVWGLLGLIVGGLFLGFVISALPRRVTLDWREQTITVGGRFSKSQIAFADVVAVEADCKRTYHSGKSSSSSGRGTDGPSYHTYRCDVRIHRRGTGTPAAASVVLVRTGEFREDPDTPYRRTLPLVTELAEALGVPRRVTDYR